jgi:hypothetical protein
MQNRYVGDVGDFAKYGLLRIVAHETTRRLGVIWYLVADENHNTDGRHTGYLRDPIFVSLDPALHLSLQKLVSTNRRSIEAVEKSGILPNGTIFFGAPISQNAMSPPSRRDRGQRRASWVRKALAATNDSEIIFFDPDNGIETASVPRDAPKGGKYVFWDELRSFWDRGQSLLIYHHLNRTATVAHQAKALKEKFVSRFPDAPLIHCFLSRRGSCRHFWLVAQNAHEPELRRVIDAVRQSAWRKYLEVG